MKEKALTIKHPWAYLICAGIKDIENRTWATKFRGRVYIHASANYTKGTFKDKLPSEYWEGLSDGEQKHLLVSTSLRSAIIGHVDIIDCVINNSSIWAEQSHYPIAPSEHPIKPIYNWVLANPVLFNEPILNVKGKLSFWDCSQYIHSEIDEDGKPVCMCNLGIDEKDQVMSLGNEFRCNYCDGKWYK